MKLRDVKLRRGTRAEIVGLAMAEEGLLNADPRDYVILNGCSIITLFGEYRVTSKLDGREVDATNVGADGAVDPGVKRTVVHRRVLWRFLGSVESKRFWRYGHRTRK